LNLPQAMRRAKYYCTHNRWGKAAAFAFYIVASTKAQVSKPEPPAFTLNMKSYTRWIQ